MKRCAIVVALFVAVIATGKGRVLASGDVDPLFSSAVSRTPVAETVSEQVVQPDGKIIVWGNDLSAGNSVGRMLRFNPDGSVDTGFNYCDCQLSSISRVQLQSDGKILVSGSSLAFQAKIVRLNTNGSEDSSFVSVFPGFGHSSSSSDVLGTQADGKVIATIRGGFTAGFHSGYVIRLNADGSNDGAFVQTNFDSGRLIFGSVAGFALTPDGSFYLAVVTSSGGVNSISLRRYLNTGAVDPAYEVPSFTGGSPSVISALLLQTDGKLIASGSFQSVNGVARSNFVRLMPAGNVDLTFQPTLIAIPGGAMKLLPDGKIQTATGGFITPVQFVRLNPDGSTDATYTHPAPVLTVSGRWDADTTGRVYFFGYDGSYKLLRTNSDGSLDAGYVPGLNTRALIYDQVAQTDGKLFITGNFTRVGSVDRQSIARLNADGSVDPAFNSGTGFDTPPNSIALQTDGKVIAVGSFATYNGVPRAGIARINTDGSLDAAFAPVVTSVLGVTLQTDGKILISGSFATVNSVARPRLARLETDGTLDNSFAPTIASGTVTTVVPLPDGKFFVGGSFTGVDGFNRSNLVRLNAGGGLDQTFNASAGAVGELLLLPDGKLFSLPSFSGTVQKFNTDGTPDASFVSPVFSANNSSDLRLSAIIRQSDGSLIIAGNFNTINGIGRNHIVRLSAAGALDQLFFPAGASGPVNSLILLAGGNVSVGGDFARINGVTRYSVARIIPGNFTRVVRFDFDGDGRADISVFRPSENKWYILRSSDFGITQQIFALNGDLPVPADFDGDGRTDIAIFRPSLGDWWSLSTISGGQVFVDHGAPGDLALPSDTSGDGRADYVIFRPSNSLWIRVQSSNGQLTQIPFGLPGDKPVVGDVDGDGKTEPVIYRPSTGDWWWQSSIDNVQRAVHWGISTDVPAAGDYDGDGKTDFAVYRPSDGVWYIRNSQSGSFTILPFGIAEDKPVPADYDGDGRTDIAVYRPSTGIWYLLKSTEGFAAYRWGIATDIPIPNAFVP